MLNADGTCILGALRIGDSRSLSAQTPSAQARPTEHRNSRRCRPGTPSCVNSPHERHATSRQVVPEATTSASATRDSSWATYGLRSSMAWRTDEQARVGDAMRKDHRQPLFASDQNASSTSDHVNGNQYITGAEIAGTRTAATK